MYEAWYNIDLATYGYLAKMFQGQVTMVMYSNARLMVNASSDVMTQLYNSGNITYASITSNYMSATTALDHYIRQNGDANYSTPVIGFVYGSSTCLHVQWPWIILPAVFAVLLLLFFAAMIVETTPSGSHRNAWNGQQPVHDFKASPLTLLFHGFEPRKHVSSADIPGEDVADTKAMEKAAEGIYVRFSPSDRGWRFVEDDGDDVDGLDMKETGGQRA
jgi:hypothetical protein